MKRLISILLCTSIMFVCCISGYAIVENEKNDAVLTVQDLRTMFPFVSLGNDGYITQEISGVSIEKETPPKSLTDCNNPVYKEDYVYPDDLSSCTLMIYDDGSFSVVGIETNNELVKAGTSSSPYKVYYNNYAVYYSMSYYIWFTTSSSTGYSTITSASSPSVSWIGQPVNPYSATMVSLGTTITRYTQNSSYPASAVGRARVYLEGVPSFVMALTGTINSGSGGKSLNIELP